VAPAKPEAAATFRVGGPVHRPSWTPALQGQYTKPAGPKPRLAAAWATAAHRARRGKEINSWRSRVSHLGKTHTNPSTPGNNEPPLPASLQHLFKRPS